MSQQNEGWAVWFVGLPGCGKTTLAKGVHEYLLAKGLDVVGLQMDKRRPEYFPNPKYTMEERERAYAMFVEEAVEFVRQGKGVLMDAAAYRVSMRTYARQRIDRFAEVFVQCDLEEAIIRETNRPNGAVIAELYNKAIARKETGAVFEGLGEVVGVDVELEQDAIAEFVIDNTRLAQAETLRKTLHFLDSWLVSD